MSIDVKESDVLKILANKHLMPIMATCFTEHMTLDEISEKLEWTVPLVRKHINNNLRWFDLERRGRTQVYKSRIVKLSVVYTPRHNELTMGIIYDPIDHVFDDGEVLIRQKLY